MSLQQAAPAAASAGPSRPAPVGRSGLLQATRPRQWLKNVLVLAAPVAAGRLLHGPVLLAAVVAMAAFTLVAAGCYLVNDVVDRELDRAHPVKRFRPIACGVVGPTRALITGTALILAGVGLAAGQGWSLVAVVGGYAVATLAYAAGLKALPWLELAIVASGFVLRALAGGVVGAVPESPWFLLVVAAAAALIVVSKRLSEIIEVPGDPGTVRPVLRRYRLTDLRRLRAAAASLLILGYAGWAITRPTAASTAFAGLSLLFLTAVVWLWIRRSDQGRAGAPEDLLVGDRTVLVLVLGWAIAFLADISAASGWR